MSLSGERKAIADHAILQTFERTSVAWQAIPHWETGDPGQVRIRNDVIFRFALAAAAQAPRQPLSGPFDLESLKPTTEHVEFTMTLAQATAATPDALLASVTSRAVILAQRFDGAVLRRLLKPYAAAAPQLAGGARSDWYLSWLQPPEQAAAPQKAAAQEASPQEAAPRGILPQLLRGRQQLEDSGYRAPCGLLSSSAHYRALNDWVDGDLVLHQLLAAAHVNSVHRTTLLDQAHIGGGATDVTVMLGRTQEFPGGRASEVSPGEEPVDLAVSVPPSLEVIGENARGDVELAVRIRFATRVKDERGVVVFHS
jgi:hypothetical protein